MNTIEQNLALAATLQPARVMQYFAEISNIPRGSGNEAGVADYLVSFAKARSLECYRDEANNVLIKKAATAGRENAPAILLQGHTDMVCEKNGDTVHDFLTDPIRLRLDGDRLRADGTTLGGDNGIAVAYMLAILDGEAAAHPALECLFTAGEEVGMDGIVAFDHSRLAARHMINLDSEGEGMITAGCAGGVRTDLVIPVGRVAAPDGSVLMKVSLRGLCGGHSGEDIHRGRMGANVLLARLLSALRREVPFSLVTLQGGSKDNAIPRECEAIICLPAQDAASAAMKMMMLSDAVAVELVDEDGDCTVSVEKWDEACSCPPMDEDATCRVLSLLNTVPQGVLKVSRRVQGLVEYSRNAGVVWTEADAVKLTLTSRSCHETLLDHAEQALCDLAGLVGGTATHRNRYPGWDFAPESRVREAYIKAFSAHFGHEPRVLAIHAGLESGYIKKQLPDMDIISVGPDMKNIHSPDEQLSLPSVSRIWQVLLTLLEAWS